MVCSIAYAIVLMFDFCALIHNIYISYVNFKVLGRRSALRTLELSHSVLRP